MSTFVESAIAQMSTAGRKTHSPAWLQVLTDIHPRYGGLSAVIPEMARALEQVGTRAPIAALCQDDEQAVPWQIQPDAIHFFPRSRRSWMLSSRYRSELQALVRQMDGVHVHGLWTSASHEAWRAARRTGRPLCVTAHGMLEPWSLQQHRLRKQCYAALVEHRVLRGAACLHALTRSEAASYRAITRDVPVAIVPNGVNVPSDISQDHFFAAYPELEGKRIILFLSRLHPKKAVDILLRSWPRVQREHPEAHLVIAGAGDAGYETTLRTFAAEHCAGGFVTFTGLLQGRMKWAALRTAECFVLPSFSEGFSVAILEALGAGTPVIATPQCNMPEIESEQCGWLTEPREDALTDVLLDVLSHAPSTNVEAGQRGRDLIQRRYTWSAIARQMSAVYDWLGGASLPSDIEVLR